MTRTTVTEEDEGKRVVDASGDRIGIISGVKSGTAYVDPDPGIAGTIKAKLGWEDIDEDDYPLREDRIDAITDDEIRLKQEE